MILIMGSENRMKQRVSILSLKALGIEVTGIAYKKKGKIYVDGDVKITKKMKKLPVVFGSVTGDFYCHNNNLTTLEGAPKKVGGDFYCYGNKLITLAGAPETVLGGFYCYYNNLPI
jgi:hypothetical protein